MGLNEIRTKQYHHYDILRRNPTYGPFFYFTSSLATRLTTIYQTYPRTTYAIYQMRTTTNEIPGMAGISRYSDTRTTHGPGQVLTGLCVGRLPFYIYIGPLIYRPTHLRPIFVSIHLRLSFSITILDTLGILGIIAKVPVLGLPFSFFFCPALRFASGLFWRIAIIPLPFRYRWDHGHGSISS